MLLLCGRVAHAHRLDEYLQATILSVEKDHVHASMRLIPGVAVASSVITSIDTDGDGLFSEQEQQAYAKRVLADLSLSLDATSLRPKLVSISIPTETMQLLVVALVMPSLLLLSRTRAYPFVRIGGQS